MYVKLQMFVKFFPQVVFVPHVCDFECFFFFFCFYQDPGSFALIHVRLVDVRFVGPCAP